MLKGIEEFGLFLDMHFPPHSTLIVSVDQQFGLEK